MEKAGYYQSLLTSGE